jgi:hypothetical protein
MQGFVAFIGCWLHGLRVMGILGLHAEFSVLREANNKSMIISGLCSAGAIMWYLEAKGSIHNVDMCRFPRLEANPRK